MDLSPLGVWYFLDGMPAPQAAEAAKRIEALGYGALWIPETVGRHPFVAASWLLSQTEKLVVATGIASIYHRDPGASAAGMKSLAEQSNGRFLLGLGVSHQPMVEMVRGHEYGKPVTTMRNYLEAMDRFQYSAVPPAEEPPRVIAALGPNMLALARDACTGAHPYFTTPEHTKMARKILGPDKWLCVEQKVLLETNANKARELARKNASIYIGLPNYRNNWKRLGFTDEDMANGGNDKFIDAVVWGDEEAIRERIQAHQDAGASHVCIQPIHPDGSFGQLHWELLEKLAPAA